MRIISLGAGVQSSTMYLMSCNGDLPRADYAIFADTQTEPAEVYEYLEYLEAIEGGVPILRVTQGNIEEEAIRWAEGGRNGIGLPLFTDIESGGILPRQCTYNFKIAPIRRKVQELRKAMGHKGVVEMWIGISLDEIQRMKPSRVKYIDHKWPLIDRKMDRRDCLSYIEYHGYEKPGKSACYHCPFRSDSSWESMKRNQPDLFQRAVSLDAKLRKLPRIESDTFLHRSLQPLDRVDFGNAEDQLDLFVNECEGYCGL